MAVSRTTTFSDTTEILARNGLSRLSAIRAYPGASANYWVQVWNAANPTPGTTPPDIQFPVYTTRREPMLVIFDKIVLDAVSYFASTAASGGTATTNTGIAVEVYYEPLT
jgi:hypothetical protein